MESNTKFKFEPYQDS